jgi:hypothetical protein
MQIILILLNLMLAVLGAAAKTTDDGIKHPLRKINPVGWTVIGILALVCAFSCWQAVTSSKEQEQTRRENQEMHANINSLTRQLAAMTQMLAQERNGQLMGLLENWEAVGKSWLGIYILDIQGADNMQRADWEPFWEITDKKEVEISFSPMPDYRVIQFLKHVHKPLGFDPVSEPDKAFKARAALREKTGDAESHHDSYTAGDDWMDHSYRLHEGSLRDILFQAKPDTRFPLVTLRFDKPQPPERVAAIKSRYCGNPSFSVELGVPVETKALVETRRRMYLDIPRNKDEKELTSFWRLMFPISLVDVQTLKETDEFDQFKSYSVQIMAEIGLPRLEPDPSPLPGP